MCYAKRSLCYYTIIKYYYVIITLGPMIGFNYYTLLPISVSRTCRWYFALVVSGWRVLVGGGVEKQVGWYGPVGLNVQLFIHPERVYVCLE